MPPPCPMEAWTPDSVTPRDIIAYREASVLVTCDGCRTLVGLNVFKVGMRLADTPLKRMRLRCRRCGFYASRIEVNRARGGMVDTLFSIRLEPIWDDGHAEAHERARKRLEARNVEKEPGKPQRPSRGP